MFFIPRGNRFYCIIARWPSYIRYIVLLITLLIITGLWWLLNYKQLREHYSRCKNEIELFSAKPQIDAILEQIALAEQNLNYNRHLLYGSRRYSSHDEIIGNLIDCMIKFMKIESVSQEEIIKKKAHSIVAVSVNATGTFYSFINFLNAIAEHDIPVWCSDCRITKTSKNSISCHCKFKTWRILDVKD